MANANSCAAAEVPCSISDIRHHSAQYVARCIMRSMSVAHFDSSIPQISLITRLLHLRFSAPPTF